MKNNSFWFVLFLAVGVMRAADTAKSPSAIPWSDVGAKAGADYRGDGLAVTPTESGARLRCVFQRLDGEASPEGLWLTSTVTNTVNDRFRVTAVEVGRKAASAPFNLQFPAPNIPLAAAGDVSVCGQTVRFSRPGLTEEYSVSMDGVRQDFIVEGSPGRATLPRSLSSGPAVGVLVVKLAVTGAKVESAAYGVRLALENSGRKIAYSRLRVTDATGKELPARIEVSSVEDGATSLNSWVVLDKDIEELGLLMPAPAREELAVVVNDADAVYPLRIDPTFSDANWVSMGGLPGTDGAIYASVVDGSGNVYIGGYFAFAGETSANNVAKWNGSAWSALGSGMNGGVVALVLSGSTLYAGGSFTNAGGSAANYIAQWNGSAWSALGSGMNGGVDALAISGGTLYAGGGFTTAGTNVSAFAAMANLAGTSVPLAIITTNAAFGFTNGVFGFDVSGPSGSNVVIQASTNLQSWIPLQTNLLGSGLLFFSDSQSPTNRVRFYRAAFLP